MSRLPPSARAATPATAVGTASDGELTSASVQGTPVTGTATPTSGSVSQYAVIASDSPVSASMGSPTLRDIALAEASQVGAQSDMLSASPNFILNRQIATKVSATTDGFDETTVGLSLDADQPATQATVTEATVPSVSTDADSVGVDATMESPTIIAAVNSEGTIVATQAVTTLPSSVAEVVNNSEALVTIDSTVSQSEGRVLIGRTYGDVTEARQDYEE